MIPKLIHDQCIALINNNDTRHINTDSLLCMIDWCFLIAAILHSQYMTVTVALCFSGNDTSGESF